MSDKEDTPEYWKKRIKGRMGLIRYWQNKAARATKEWDIELVYRSRGYICGHYAEIVEFLANANEKASKGLKKKIQRAEKNYRDIKEKYKEYKKTRKVKKRNRTAGIAIRSLLQFLVSAESLLRASIRGAEVHMQRIEKLAAERKILRYHVSELTEAVKQYSVLEGCLYGLEGIVKIIADTALGLNRNQRTLLAREVKNIIKVIKSHSMQYEQEKNILEKLETLVLKIELGKIKKTTKKEA